MNQSAASSALKSSPFHRARALDARGSKLFDARRYDDALEYFRAAIAACPDWAIPWHHLGCVNARLQDVDAAINAFEASIERDPMHDGSYVALFHLLARLGRNDEAETWLSRLDELRPGYAETAFLLGSAALAHADYERAAKLLNRGLSSPIPTLDTRMLPYGVVSEPRLLHDLDQCIYLAERGLLDEQEARRAQRGYEWVLDAFPRHESKDWTTAPAFRLEPEVLSMLRPIYRRIAHLGRADRVDGDPLTPGLDTEAIGKRILTDGGPRWAVVDRLLRPEVVDKLQQFLWTSTIWHNDAQKGRNYLAAYRQNGLACPLIWQIGESLHQALPEILGDLELIEFWAYRVAVGDTAVGTHADSTAININVWLTPDDALLSGAGGLLIYDRIAPPEWDYSTYNDDREAIERFLQDITPTRIPYRQNRAVIFDSKLFHASDAGRFGSGFEDARINLTFLFG